MTLEAARVLGLLLVIVVGVERIRQLILAVAHAVHAVLSGGRVALDAAAQRRVLAADEVEDVAVARRREAIGRHALARLDHAAAHVGVGRRRQRVAGLPRRVDGRAAHGLVAGVVVGHGDALGLGTADLGLQGGKVLLLARRAVAADLDQPCVAVRIRIYVSHIRACDAP